jgi:hypothetical protein
MSNRFEVSISPNRRAALDALARELGCSSSDLARIGVSWVLQHREVLISGPARQAEQQRASA